MNVVANGKRDSSANSSAASALRCGCHGHPLFALNRLVKSSWDRVASWMSGECARRTHARWRVIANLWRA